jgi:hypothetical protein
VLPPLAGISNADFGNAAAFNDGFQMAMMIAGVLLIAGGVLAWFTIRRSIQAPGAGEPSTAISYCALDAPPLRVDRAEVT